MKTRRLVLGLAMSVTLGCGADQADATLDEGESTQELRLGAASGTLYFAGCAPRLEEVRVEAVPVGVTARVPRGEAVVALGEAVTPVRPVGVRSVPGVVWPTLNSHRLRFVFPVLTAGAFQLSVRVNNAACAGARWRGPTGGMIFSGQHDRHFEALVPRTSLGVVRPGGRVAFAADAVPLDAAQGPTGRALSVQTTLDGQTEYELQLSTGRPRNTLTRLRGACAETAGIVYRQPLTLRPRATTLVPFDLSRILARLDVLSIGDSIDRTRVRPSVAYLRGRPLYARVVPVRAVCDPESDGASASVTLRVPSLPSSPAIAAPRLPITFEGHYEPGSQAPRYTPQPTTHCYQTLSPHQLPHAFSTAWINDYINDPFGGSLVIQQVFVPLTVLPEGTLFCVTPSGSSGSGGGGLLGDVTGTFGDLTTGAIDATAWTVNQASALYDEIQATVVNVAAAVIDALPLVDCDAICRDGLKLGLQTGLAALGLPPSLPNFDALVDGGVDYLIATAAEQAGVPPELASLAVHAAIDEVKAQRGVATTANPNAWFTLADPGLNETTRLTLSVPPAWLSNPGTLDVFSAPFTDATYPIPSGSGAWTIPIVHQRNYEGLGAPPPTTVTTLGGVLTIPQSESYVRHWYFTQWRARHMAASCLMMQLKLRDQNANVVTGAVPFVQPNGVNDWSTPGMTNRCQ